MAAAAVMPPILPARLLPIPTAIAAARRNLYTAEGHCIQQLLTADDRCYQFVRTLQQALMGKVKSAVICHRQPDGSFLTAPPFTLVAIKQLAKSCVARGVTLDGKPVKENPLAEVAVLHYLCDAAAGNPGHPNVMRLLQFAEDDSCYYIIYEFLNGGELFDQVAVLARPEVTLGAHEAQARRYFWDVLQGVRYIHSRGISHRDLSLENAMIHTPSEAIYLAAATGKPQPQPQPPAHAQVQGGDAAGGGAGAGAGAGAGLPSSSLLPSVKLIDFGLALLMPHAPAPPALAASGLADAAASAAASFSEALLPSDGRIGKERYMAGETYAGMPYSGTAIDVWCLGMMLFVLTFGIYPYRLPSAAHCAYYKEIERGNLLAMLRNWGFDKRASPTCLHLIDRLLTVDPARRARTEEIAAHPWLQPERDRVAAEAAAAAAAPAAAWAASAFAGFVAMPHGHAASAAPAAPAAPAAHAAHAASSSMMHHDEEPHVGSDEAAAAAAAAVAAASAHARAREAYDASAYVHARVHAMSLARLHAHEAECPATATVAPAPTRPIHAVAVSPSASVATERPRGVAGHVI